jgi:phenylacetate-coenzyme A ligase PaaK-like adenylate-forming protein
MSELLSFRDRLLNLNNDHFTVLALDIFKWQAQHNPVYRKYISYLNKDPKKISRLEDIPFLPIEFFKNHAIKTGEWDSSLMFSSSGTTGSVQSSHYLDDPLFYEKLTKEIFESMYGSLSNFHIVALLPSYLERSGSSLIYMIEHFIKLTGSKFSGFFLRDDSTLLSVIEKLKRQDGKKLLIGVTFALIDLSERHQMDLSDFIVMETGGMKGRGKELTRAELHALLSERLNVERIHSEYGMTELMSQAYSDGGAGFVCPRSMRVMVRDINDPFSYLPEKRAGGLNIIDLGNIHSCCFIETKDLGRIANTKGDFEVLGRFDNSDVRGCNLLIQ